MKLLGEDELTDVFVLLDRITLDALLVVSRKCSDVVQFARLCIARRTMGYVWIGVTSHRGKIPRFLDRLRKKPRPWPHEIHARMGSEHYADFRMHFGNDQKRRSDLWYKETELPSPEACYRYLSLGLPVSRINELHLSFRPTSSAIADAFQSPDVRHGCVDELVLGRDLDDFFRLAPNVFENLPFLSGSIHRLELRAIVSPQQQSDRFVRNCMRRCVRTLKATGKNWDPTKIPSGVCDVREDTILEFCFRSDLQEHQAECRGPRGERTLRNTEQGPEVQLWLNFVSLSDDFLQRFVRASENCPSDHKVWLFLCGENLERLDISGCERSYDGLWQSTGYAKHCIFRGKTSIDARINLRLGFMAVIRRPLEETYEYDKEDDDFMAFLDPPSDLESMWPPCPSPTLGQRIRRNTIGRFRRFMHEWF